VSLVTADQAEDWTITRCPDCGAWTDVTTPAFERYGGCVACAMIAADVLLY
jgi:hypothetical protein